MSGRVDHQRAIIACTEAIDGLPEDAVSYFQRAYHRSALGELVAALADVRESKRLGLSGPELDTLESQLERSLARGDSSGSLRRPSEVARPLEEAYNNGVVAFNQKDFKEAIRAFSLALALDSEMTSAYFSRALCRLQLGELATAVLDLCQILAREPLNAQARRQRALAYHRQGRLDEAEQDWDFLIQAEPDDAQAYYYRGVLRRQKNQTSAALVDFEACLARDESLIDAWFQSGLLLNQSGDSKSAIRAFDQVHRLQPDYQPAFAPRALAWLRLGDGMRALRDAESAVQHGPQDINAYYIRGIIRAARSENAPAFEDLSRVIEANPNHREARSKRAELAKLISRHEVAREDRAFLESGGSGA